MPERDPEKYIGKPSHDEFKQPVTQHRDFPRVFYKDDAQKLVKKADDEKALLGAGWSRTPPLPEKDDDSSGPARSAPAPQAKTATKK